MSGRSYAGCGRMRVAQKMACESVHIKRFRGNVADVTARSVRFQGCALSAADGVESGTTRINLKAPHPDREATIVKSSHRLMIGSPAHVAGLELAGKMLRRAGGHGWRSCVRSYRAARSESPERLHVNGPDAFTVVRCVFLMTLCPVDEGGSRRLSLPRRSSGRHPRALDEIEAPVGGDTAT